MRHVWLAGAVAGAALLFTGAVPRPAEALPISKPAIANDSGITLVRRGGHGHGGGHHFGGGGRHFGGHVGRHFGGGGRPHFRGRHRGRGIRFYPRYYGYAPYYYDYYDYYYDDSCAWLRRKALRTGSRYWWRRYHRCLRYYD